jgi:hypothetical protein
MKPSQQNGSSDSVVGSIAGLGNDIATLVELQWKLFAADFNELVARARLSAVLLAAGVVLALGSVPVLVGGVGLLLASALNISSGLGLLLSALAAVILAGVAVALAVGGLRHSLDALRRSREELQRNIAWIRTVLVQSGRTLPRRRW